MGPGYKKKAWSHPMPRTGTSRSGPVVSLDTGGNLVGRNLTDSGRNLSRGDGKNLACGGNLPEG
jgi:hypothetical protein